jgi:hypothetical protein
MRSFATIAALVLALTCPVANAARSSAAVPRAAGPSRAALETRGGWFEPNVGRSDAAAQFVGRVGGLAVTLGADRFAVARDTDWASWYADWLLDHSEPPTLLGTTPVRSHLVHALVELDRRQGGDGGWEDAYAEGLVELFPG